MSASSRTITVAGLPIRLYPAPEPGAAFPWASFADLLQAAEFPVEAVPSTFRAAVDEAVLRSAVGGAAH